MKIRISNDAFYYLSEGEEPLDDIHLDEALHYIECFPRGYCIKPLPEKTEPGYMWCEITDSAVTDSECEITTASVGDSWWDMEEASGLRFRLRVKFISEETIHVYMYDTADDKITADYGTVHVERDNKWEPFTYGNGSRQYLARFIPKKA